MAPEILLPGLEGTATLVALRVCAGVANPIDARTELDIPDIAEAALRDLGDPGVFGGSDPAEEPNCARTLWWSRGCSTAGGVGSKTVVGVSAAPAGKATSTWVGKASEVAAASELKND